MSPEAPAPMSVELRPLDAVRPYANNPRQNDDAVEAVAESIRRFGFRQPIVVDADGVIVAGHTRFRAAQRLGLATVPVHVATDLSPDDVRAYRLADNKTAELASWDDAMLSIELDALRGAGIDWTLLGFDEEELAKLLAPAGTEGLTDPDAVPEKPADPITKPGDLWLLGKHRLLCGDSMDRANISRLYADDVVDFILTDPPYCSGGFQEAGRSVGSTQGVIGKKIARDNLTTEGLANLIEASIGRLPCEGACYVFCDWRQIFAIRKAVEPLGYQYKSLLVWDKGSPGTGGPWRHGYEMVYFGTKRKEPPTGKSGDVIRCSRSGNKNHTTEKPVQLIATIIDNTEGQAIADPFLGSGTTLIAAEQLGRKCYGMEISPAYCDVIVKRWENLTGRKATRG